MTPKVSIIVPVYNVELYLERCLESIVNQTYTNLEIIIVNDGSTDNSLEICEKWKNIDNRIKVKSIENNGVSNARNVGISMVTGDYLYFADSDDYLEPDIIEFLLKNSVNNDADVVRCGFVMEFDNGTKENYGNDECTISNYDNKVIDLIVNDYISGALWNKLYRFSAVKEYRFDVAYDSSEDLAYNYSILKSINKIVNVPDAKYHHFIRQNSITHSAFGYGAFSIISAKQIILNDQKDNQNTYKQCVRSYIDSAFIVLTGCLSHNACMDRYDDLRASILEHKKTILKSSSYTYIEKLKVILLDVFPKLYNKIFSKRG